VNRTAQIYLELHFCVELHNKKSPDGKGAEGVPACPNQELARLVLCDLSNFKVTPLFHVEYLRNGT